MAVAETTVAVAETMVNSQEGENVQAEVVDSENISGEPPKRRKGRPKGSRKPEPMDEDFAELDDEDLDDYDMPGLSKNDKELEQDHLDGAYDPDAADTGDGRSANDGKMPSRVKVCSPLLKIDVQFSFAHVNL